MHSVRFKTCFVALSLLGAATLANAGLDGSSVDFQYDYPSLGSVYADFGTVTVNNTVEYPSVYIGTDWSLEVTNDQVIWTYLDGFETFYAGSSFNGLDLIFTGATITGATVDGSSTLDPVSVSNTSSQIFVNFSGLAALPGAQTVIDVSSGSSTPAPAALLPMIGGLAAIARRRFRR